MGLHFAALTGHDSKQFIRCFLLSQGMVVILHGDHTASVQSHVEVESKVASELAPIHHQVAEERIVRSWGQIPRAENAIIRSVQVRRAINVVFSITTQ